jgi:hypothetical protein
VNPGARADVNHFHGIIAERGDKQLVFPVKSKMIEPALDAAHWNGFSQYERPRQLWRCFILSRRLNNVRDH